MNVFFYLLGIIIPLYFVKNWVFIPLGFVVC